MLTTEAIQALLKKLSSLVSAAGSDRPSFLSCGFSRALRDRHTKHVKFAIDGPFDIDSKLTRSETCRAICTVLLLKVE